MLRQDFVKRLIDELGRVMARLAGRHVEDLASEETALDDIKRQLPIAARHLDREDPALLHAMLGSSEMVLLGARLLLAEGRLHELRGEPKPAARCYARSVRLFLLGGGIRTYPDDPEPFREIAARWFPESLSDADRQKLGLEGPEAGTL